MTTDAAWRVHVRSTAGYEIFIAQILSATGDTAEQSALTGEITRSVAEPSTSTTAIATVTHSHVCSIAIVSREVS